MHIPLLLYLILILGSTRHALTTAASGFWMGNLVCFFQRPSHSRMIGTGTAWTGSSYLIGGLVIYSWLVFLDFYFIFVIRMKYTWLMLRYWLRQNFLQIKTAGDWETYHRFSFLSNDTIIFPNTSEWCIELCNIITDPPGSSCTHDQDCPGILIPTLILALPELRDTTTLWGFGCDTQQPSAASPYGDADDIASTKDSSSFQSPLANGLVVFSFSMDYRDADGTGNISDIRFVIHKQALFELLSSSSTAEATNEEPLCLPWPQWGPSRTRWFDAHEPADFSPTTWGQRIVIIRPKYSHSDCRPIYVYNFNPVAVSTTTSTASTTVITSLDPFNLNEDWDSTGSQAAFQETIWSQLPCIISESPFDFGCISGAVMDRDRIILLRVCPVPCFFAHACVDCFV